MSPDELDRLFEVLLYLYFHNFPEDMVKKSEFWETINHMCITFNISSVAVIRSVRILTASENVPQEDETYYLLNKLGMSVRPIRRVSGIYWQKQKAFEERFRVSPPKIYRRIVDPVLRKNLRDFIATVYKFTGIFTHVDFTLMEEVL